MPPRLPPLTPRDLDPGQRQLYDDIVGGDRARGVQHFPLTSADGALHGPFGVMLHAPEVGSALESLGAALRYHSSLTPRIREIAILLVATHLDSAFERWAHERIGRAAGLTEVEVAALRTATFSSDDPEEQAATELCRTLLAGVRVDDRDHAAYAVTLGTVAMVELTSLVGYYRTLADLMSLFDVGIPENDEGP